VFDSKLEMCRISFASTPSTTPVTVSPVERTVFNRNLGELGGGSDAHSVRVGTADVLDYLTEIEKDVEVRGGWEQRAGGTKWRLLISNLL